MLRDLNKADDRYLGSPRSGILGSLIPSSGDAGPAYLYPLIQNDSGLLTEELRGQVTIFPSNGDFQVFDDTSFIYTAYSDGTDNFTFQPFMNGMPYGDQLIVELITGEEVVVPTTPKPGIMGRLMTQIRAMGF